jgi:hypothetical protein
MVIKVTDIKDGKIEAITVSGNIENGLYYVEPNEAHTLNQMRAIHALLQVYYASGLSSRPDMSFEDFRNWYKLHLGEGFESYVYWNGGKIVKVKNREDIPDDCNNADRAFGKLKSMSKYTKRQLTKFIDLLIVEMEAVGICSSKYGAKYEEIRRGMETNG